jgi:hypothetical protein
VFSERFTVLQGHLVLIIISCFADHFVRLPGKRILLRTVLLKHFLRSQKATSSPGVARTEVIPR